MHESISEFEQRTQGEQRRETFHVMSLFGGETLGLGMNCVGAKSLAAF